MLDLINEVFRKQPILTIAGAIHVALAFILILGLVFDNRSILGLNPWVKPLKFAISIAIYLFTMALFLSYFSLPDKSHTWLAFIIASTLILEIALISIQSLRGTTSHFNIGTPLNAAIFAVMGIAITVNTIALCVVLWHYCVNPPALSPAYVWGIRLGLAVFVLASLQGFMMASRGAHTVGAPDGGAGLPFVNWSIKFGDLRVAHFVGLHALQIIPLAGYLTSNASDPSDNNMISLVTVFSVAGLVSGLMLWTLIQALNARPLVGGE